MIIDFELCKQFKCCRSNVCVSVKTRRKYRCFFTVCSWADQLHLCTFQEFTRLLLYMLRFYIVVACIVTGCVVSQYIANNHDHVGRV